MSAEDIRCGKCNRLVGRKLPDGSVEVRHRGDLLVQVMVGNIYCPNCTLAVGIQVNMEPDESVPGLWTFRTSEA